MPSEAIDNLNESENQEDSPSFGLSNISRFRPPHSVEKTLAPYQVASATAFTLMLSSSSLISDQVAGSVLTALKSIEDKLKQGDSFLLPADIDIYSGLERKLDELVSPAANILRMGLSPNDHMACDIRLWLRDECLGAMDHLLTLRMVIMELANTHIEVVMPGYSHMQPATPELLSHWWLASASRFARDFSRLDDCFKRINLCPLGAGAFAGSNQPIDRNKLSELLGFDSVIENSLDAVCDRDFVVEITGCASLIAVHISQLATELILWSTQEFGYVRLPRSFAYKSRNFPQKRNPEPLEVLRSRTAQISGRMTQFLEELKGIPISYSHDLQESLPGLLEVFENLRFILDLTSLVLPVMIFDTVKMERQASFDLANAGNVMDYLIEKSFEPDKAAKIVDEVMEYCRQRNKHFIDMTRGEWQEFSPAFHDDIYRYITASTAIDIKSTLGGTAHMQVEAYLERSVQEWKLDRERLKDMSAKILNNPLEDRKSSI